MMERQETQTAAGVGFVVVVAAVLVAYSSTAHLIPGYNALYVPLNLVAGTMLAAAATRRRLGLPDLGLQRTTMRAGVAWGAGAVAVVAAVLALAVAVPGLHPFFDDARIAGVGPGLLAYRALVRIPLGTALFEEFAFRGVLFGAWTRVTGPFRAALGSSLVFGLWHIRPAIGLLDANDLAASSLARASAVALSVLATAVAGYVFCLLRIKSGSLLAPFIAHAATNSLAVVAAYLVTGGG
jgi:membrane protease YdiL (CAAX protease family)